MHYMNTALMIDKFFILLFLLVLIVSIEYGWQFYRINVERAMKWETMHKLTAKAKWWLEKGNGILIISMLSILNCVIVISLWSLFLDFNPLSILRTIFIGVVLLLLYRQILKTTVEDPTNPKNFT